MRCLAVSVATVAKGVATVVNLEKQLKSDLIRETTVVNLKQEDIKNITIIICNYNVYG